MDSSSSLGTTVLVVDDEFLLRATIADVLRESGYHVVEAASADTAIAILEAGTVVDAVVTDLHLPGRTSGADWLRWLARCRPGTPTLLASGSDLASMETARLPTVHRIIHKPFDFVAMERALLDVLQEPCVAPA